MTLNFDHGITVEQPDVLVRWYNGTRNGGKPNVRHGPAFYSTSVVTGVPNSVSFPDLVWATLLDGQPRGDAALHLLNLGRVSLTNVATAPLHSVSPVVDISGIAAVLSSLCGPGVGCSIVSKMAHRKRRATIPVMDNGAIFGSFDNASWLPWDTPRRVGTVKQAIRIEKALLAIHKVVALPANDPDWLLLETSWPNLTRVQLFDQCWWAMLWAGASVRYQAGVLP
jgi:hypothetical protein